MTLDKQLNYQGYEHKYNENDILVLKSIEELSKINKILVTTENHDAFKDSKWYLTKEMIESLSSKKLKVLSCISWHMGIPFYMLENIEDESNIVFAGEFYLKNEGNN